MGCVDPWRAVRQMERSRTEEMRAIFEREGTAPGGVPRRAERRATLVVSSLGGRFGDAKGMGTELAAAAPAPFGDVGRSRRRRGNWLAPLQCLATRPASGLRPRSKSPSHSTGSHLLSLRRRRGERRSVRATSGTTHTASGGAFSGAVCGRGLHSQAAGHFVSAAGGDGSES